MESAYLLLIFFSFQLHDLANIVVVWKNRLDQKWKRHGKAL